jgi:hypothetical protein
MHGGKLTPIRWIVVTIFFVAFSAFAYWRYGGDDSRQRPIPAAPTPSAQAPQRPGAQETQPEQEELPSEPHNLKLANQGNSGAFFYVDDTFACEIQPNDSCGIESEPGWKPVSATSEAQTHTSRVCVRALEEGEEPADCVFSGQSLICTGQDGASCD